MAIDDPRQAQGVTSTEMEELTQGIQLFSEKTLRDIAKGPLVKFTLTCQEIE